MNAVRLIPSTTDPLIIRTESENLQAWNAICTLIRAPVPDSGYTFYANVEFLDDPEFRSLGPADLLARVPAGYRHSFLCVVDGTAVAHPGFPTLGIVLRGDRGRSFRAVPSTIQGIENNLSISNMDFCEFADNVDQDGIFRGFPSH
jgi:hypothetical protein